MMITSLMESNFTNRTVISCKNQSLNEKINEVCIRNIKMQLFCRIRKIKITEFSIKIIIFITNDKDILLWVCFLF